MTATSPDDEAIQRCKRFILQVVVGEKVPPEEARRRVKRLGIDFHLADLAYEEIRIEMQENLVSTPAVINRETYAAPGAAWYVRPDQQPSWDHYLGELEAASSPALEELDAETTEIVKLLADPRTPGSRRKGLVMGNVQSGKTRSFAGVAAKAADAGYKLVIVLAGMHDNLRDQTQSRLDAQLFDGDRWYSVTQVGQDFQRINSPEQILARMPVVVAVVKKNIHRLNRLIRTLDQVSPQARSRFPVLIVDDEADQASPNSLAQQQRISAINGRLRDLWSLVVTGTYLAYTATPFANVLIDPDEAGDLFPSDFIKAIPPGQGYFGAERVFGISETVDDQGNGVDGLDMVRTIPDTESSALRPPSDREARELFDPELPASLIAAFRWFVVATAVRRARGQHGHSSMLVHTTHYTAPHAAMRQRLADLKDRALADIRLGHTDAYRISWDEEATRVASEGTVKLPSWEEVSPQLQEVVDAIEVIMDNGNSEDRLNYGEEPRTVIAVGGGTLSRGLTLEGLVVSYFTRTSNTYDTLLQMGRWFGYRQGYEDLPRVWVGEGLEDDYAFLARVEQDIRAEIESVQGSEFIPAQVGIRVRSHPGRLQVTAANKMWARKVVQLGLSETSNQTFILSAADTGTNLTAVNKLLRGAHLEGVSSDSGRLIARGVEGARVSTFLEEFVVHGDQRWLADPENLENMQQWLAANADGPVWNVVVAANSRTTAPDGITSLGNMVIAGHDVKCLNRAPLQASTEQRLNFKAIASPDDRIADIDPSKYRGEPHTNDVERRRIRRTHAAGRGLVLIYPISADSRATPPTGDRQLLRMDMPGDGDVLGFAIFFPAANDATGGEGTFVSVRKTWEVPEVTEGDEDDVAGEEEEEE